MRLLGLETVYKNCPNKYIFLLQACLDKIVLVQTYLMMARCYIIRSYLDIFIVTMEFSYFSHTATSTLKMSYHF